MNIHHFYESLISDSENPQAPILCSRETLISHFTHPESHHLKHRPESRIRLRASPTASERDPSCARARATKRSPRAESLTGTTVWERAPALSAHKKRGPLSNSRTRKRARSRGPQHLIRSHARARAHRHSERCFREIPSRLCHSADLPGNSSRGLVRKCARDGIVCATR